MSVIDIVIFLIIVAVLLWGVRALPMLDATVKQIITVVVVVAAALWLLHGLTGEGPAINWGFRHGRG